MVNSIEFKKQMKDFFGINSYCIYNPLNKNEIIYKKVKKKTNYIFGKQKTLRILNIGRFVDQKDQETLIKALNVLKNKIKFQARIIGRGQLKEKLKKLINKYKLSRNVKLINFKKKSI